VTRDDLPDAEDLDPHAERTGRIALATQGLLYLLLGVLALEVAGGDRSARPSQRGALATVARQPFGRLLLIVVTAGLAAHALWRLWLAAVGEPGPGDDAKSAAKRAANLGRAAIYVGLVASGVRLIARSGGGSDGQAPRKATTTVLGWPGGPWLVVIAGLVLVAAGAWNARRAVTRSFADDLDPSRGGWLGRRWACRLGVAGYLARGFAFGLVGWFLVDAGRQHDPGESQGLDGSLRQLTAARFGPAALVAVAVGLACFGLFRGAEAWMRREGAVTRA
jgi:hypothetical protein